MANIDLPEKEIFNQRVRAVQGRIEGITKSNTMAGLLNNNFKKWLSSSSMSPLKLTQELDNNSDGVISGDEFATLLGKMTGERPPEWVVELVFSFVDADVNRGIPLDDWMAFLAASGMEIPDEMFKKKVVVAGSIAIDHKKFETGQTVSVSVSFNVEVVAYEFAVVNQKDMREVHSSLTPNVDMDRPDFDEFEIELDDPGTYVAELRHLGVRLDTETFEVVQAYVEPVVEPPVHSDIEVVDAEVDHPPAAVPAAEGFAGFVARVEAVKLRSEAQALIGEAPAFAVDGDIQSVSRTLLGTGDYRNGYTLHCENSDGCSFRVMFKPREPHHSAGDAFVGSAFPHDWDVALKQLVCREA
ncbi:MAG: hypothetical protein VX451_05405 [Candidatus Thermoplasmatota archaeon]|nr:hypothetical protein [Candidatus Thermoplasmatota archaeon]